MRNLSKDIVRSGIGPAALASGARRARAGRAAAFVAPTGVDLVAPTTDLQLPSLGSVPASYTHLSGTKLLYQLCRALVEEDAGDGQLWQEAQENPLSFAEASLSRWVSEHGGTIISDYIGYQLSVQDGGDEYNKNLIRDKDLYLTVECETCGYLMIGAALEALESAVAGLGTAFYSVLVSSLCRWMRIWDDSDAGYVIEMQREWALSEVQEAENPEEALKQYELADMEKVVPPYARRSGEAPLRKYVELLSAHKRGKYEEWINRLLSIHRLARQKPTGSVHAELEGYYEDDPLPALLVVFEKHDAIEQTFDEASQSMYEVEHAPLVSIRMNPASRQDVRGALRSLEIFLRLNKELCGLIDSLNKFQEAIRGRSSGNRNQPPLRAA